MISNYQAIRQVISQMSGQDNVFTVPRIYVKYTGDITTAVLLNQIVFYSDKSKRTDGYFYKTYKEWEEEICLTERQVRYSVGKLKKLGVVKTKVMKANGSPTVHYKLNYDVLVNSILTKCQNRNLQNVSMENDKVSESLTEITTENTTEIKREEEESVNAHLFYQQNIGRNSPMIDDQITDFLNDMQEQVIVEAMKEAVLHNAYNFAYVKRVINDWLSKGVKTMDDLERIKNQAQSKSRKPNQPQQEDLPAWIKNDTRDYGF